MALPFVWRNDYVIDVAITALIWMVLNQSWNLLLGIGGIWNFGQLAIFAIGGYVAGLVSIRWGIPPWLAMIVGGLAACSRERGDRGPGAAPARHLRVAADVLLRGGRSMLVIPDESGMTGGSFGLSGIPDLAFEGLSPDAKQRAYYWLALAIVALTALFIWVFIHSPLGAALEGPARRPDLRGIARGEPHEDAVDHVRDVGVHRRHRRRVLRSILRHDLAERDGSRSAVALRRHARRRRAGHVLRARCWARR